MTDTMHTDACRDFARTVNDDRCRCLALPVSDPSETLALIEKYRLTVWPANTREQDGKGWEAVAEGAEPEGALAGRGPTIGDAVRACVAKLKALDLSDRFP